MKWTSQAGGSRNLPCSEVICSDFLKEAGDALDLVGWMSMVGVRELIRHVVSGMGGSVAGEVGANQGGRGVTGSCPSLPSDVGID